jgi:hypothetical protein
VIASAAKKSFTAHTALTWDKFSNDVSIRLGDDTPKPIQLAYRISGESGKMIVLDNVVEWDDALMRICAKIKAARKHAVNLEVKNLVSVCEL